MRPSVALLCLGCLALTVMLVRQHPAQFPQQTPPPRIQEAIAVHISGTKADAPDNVDSRLVSDSAALEQQILDALNSGDPGDQAMIFTNQFLALIALDPQAAARLAESSEPGDWRTELMRTVAGNWAKSDLPETARWIATLENSDERDTMLGVACFSAPDPAQTVQILQAQGLNDRRQIMLGNLVQQWASQDLQAAVTWVDNYPPGDVRDHLFEHIATAQSQNAPSQAAETVASTIPPGPIQNEAAFLVLDQWAQKDWNGAAAWASLFPAGGIYDQGQTTLNGVSRREQTAGTSELTIQQ